MSNQKKPCGISTNSLDNSRGSAMSKQFLATRINNAYWRVVFSHPPMNLIDPDTILEVQQLAGEIGTDENLRAVLFESSDPEYFFSRYDLTRAADTPTSPGPSGLPTRIGRTPVVSVALIRGRTRGGDSELTLAMDMRFASLEKAIFGQPEVAAGVLPGGGAIERLPLLTGRARARNNPRSRRLRRQSR